ncbi:unnamed protein product, partial [Ixodes persulcatus]
QDSEKKTEIKGKSWRREREERGRRQQAKALQVEHGDQKTGVHCNNNMLHSPSNNGHGKKEDVAGTNSNSHGDQAQLRHPDADAVAEMPGDVLETTEALCVTHVQDTRAKEEAASIEENEKAFLDLYIAETRERHHQKTDLRNKNLAAAGNWKLIIIRQIFAGGRPEEAFFSKLDSNLRKNTAFVKKLKTITEAQRDSLMKDMSGLNLTKYISEAAAAIVEAKLKMSDVQTAVLVCSALHQRYAEFSTQLLENWVKALPLKKDDKTTNLSKIRVDLRFFAELLSSGVFTQKEGLPVLKNLLTFLTTSDRDDHSNLNILLSFCKHCGDDFAGLVSRRVRQLAEKHHYALPSSDFLAPEKQKGVQALLREYFRSLCRHLLRDHKNLQSLERHNRRVLQTKGELSADQREKCEATHLAFQKLLTGTQQLAVRPFSPCLCRITRRTNLDNKGFSKICSCVTHVGHVYARTALSLSSFQALACLVSFASALLIKTINVFVTLWRKRPSDTKYPASIVHPVLHGFSCRLAFRAHVVLGISSRYFFLIFSTIDAGVCGRSDASVPGASNAIMLKESKVCTLNTHIALVCLEFSRCTKRSKTFLTLARDVTHRCAQVLFFFFSVCLACSCLPAWQARAAGLFFFVVCWIRVPSQHSTKCLSFMPFVLIFLRISAQKATFAAPKHRFGFSKSHFCCSKTLFWLLQKVLQNGLGQSHHCKWTSARKYIFFYEQIKFFIFSIQPEWNGYFYVSSKNMAKLDAVQCLRQHKHCLRSDSEIFNFKCSFLPSVEYKQRVKQSYLNASLEKVNLIWNVNHPKYNQRRVSIVHYLGELYNYRMVESSVIFKVLYSFITFGVAFSGPYSSGALNDLDPPDSLFRIRLVCILLETCGQYFNTGSSKKKLDCFLVFFQRYYWQKKSSETYGEDNPFPVTVDFLIKDVLTPLRPKMRICESLEESTAVVENLMTELKPKLMLDSEESDSKGAKDQDSLGCIQEVEEDPDEENHSAECSDPDVEMEGDGDTDVFSGSQSQPLEDEVASSSEDDAALEDDRECSQDVTLLGRRTKRAPCPEDDDFMTAFDKMLSESILHRSQDSVKPQADIVIPMSLKGGHQKKTYSNLLEQKHEEEKNTMNFILMTRKGNKPQFKSLEVPVSSELAQNLKDREEAERAEKEQVKMLTLNINERQEEEDYQEMLAAQQRPVVLNLNRDRRHKYQHPKGAPDADLIFGNK